MKSIYCQLNKKFMNIFSGKWFNNLAFTAFALFIAALFYTITKWTPIAGDDWGYALNGLNGNPFAMALQFYQTWSGRFFSELWGFVVAPNKWLWNLLNTLLFFLIFIFSVLLSSKKKTYFISGLIIIMLILKVSGYLRMETYTWVMGGTYVVPLMLSLLYFLIIEKHVLYRKDFRINWLIVPTSFICFYIGLSMENIAIIMVLAELLFIGYHFYYYHKIQWFIAINLLFSSVSLAIMRLSPGSAYRLLSDHYLWNQQSIIEKILGAMPDFIQYTFIENKYVLFVLCLALLGLLFRKMMISPQKNYLILGIVSSLYLLFVMIVVGATNLIVSLNFDFMAVFLDNASIYVWIFWIIFVAVVFWLIIWLIDGIKAKQKIIFFVLIAGASNVVMLLSPIFGSRSSLYFVYFLMIAAVLLYQELELQDGIIMCGISLILGLLIYRSTFDYITKYQQVNAIQQERLSIIQYYIANPDVKEVHIPRMPPYSIHGADIEEGDTYHFDTFKEYYGLAEDTTIIFEWKDSY